MKAFSRLLVLCFLTVVKSEKVQVISEENSSILTDSGNEFRDCTLCVIFLGEGWMVGGWWVGGDSRLGGGLLQFPTCT